VSDGKDLPALNTVRLEDGRLFAWYEFGDPHGKPCVYVPGTPESGLAGSCYDSAARMAGVRWISVDKPGYGRSDPAPERTLSAFAADIDQLAGHLGVASFAVAGESGGGPHALAVSARGTSTIDVVILLGSASTGRRGVPRGLTPLNTLVYWSLKLGVHGARVPMVVMAASMRHGRALSLLNRFFESGVPQADVDAMSAPEYARRMDAVPDAFRQGTGPAAAELYMLNRPWDFELSEVRDPVHMWHGVDDANVPLDLAKDLGRHIANLTSHFCTGSAHAVGFDRRHEVMEVVDAAVRAPAV
jgi:pimeloyl-ACP methyl ester carboxylesterase